MAHRKSLTRAAKQRRIAHFLAQPLQAPAPGQSATLTGVQKADLEARLAQIDQLPTKTDNSTPAPPNPVAQ